MSGFWPVAAVPVGGVACATTLWRAKGRLSVTVVVKARFRFVHNGEMTALPAEPVHPEAGELAPYLTQADVVLSAAHAHPRSASPAPALAVRLAVFREWAVIDKSLLVYPADDEGRRAHAVTGEIPVVKPATSKLPQGILVNPSEASRPGTLGPLSPTCAERLKLLGEAQVPLQEEGVYEVPNMFPWAYFQVAPPDQRTSYLRGDEWIVLDGLDREHPRLQSRLPRARAQVFVYPPGLTSGSCFAVHMEADHLAIDVDQKACSMVWRGSFPVADQTSARSLILVGGVATPEKPVAWPDIPALMNHPLLHAHGLVQQRPRGLPTPRKSLVQEDEASMAKTRNMSAADAAAMFGALDDDDATGEFAAFEDEAPESVSSSEMAQLEMSSDGVLSVHTLSESVVLEVMQFIGEEEAQASVTDEKGTKKRTALGLPKPARVLKPVHITGHPGPMQCERTRSEVPALDERSVDQLEVTLSDALVAQGIPTIDDLPWRRDSDEEEG